MKKSTLHVFLGFLGLAHVLTALHWGPIDYFLAQTLLADPPLCWPFGFGCSQWRSWFVPWSGPLLWAFGIASLVSSLLYFSGRGLRAAWGFAALGFALKLLISIQDYRFSGNFHYMLNGMWLVMLFCPRKKDTALLMLVSFYVGAGLLKLNADWLQGLALIRPTFLSGAWLYLACAYVVVLELVLVWGLLSRRSFFFWSTWAQLLVFHIFSWHIVGYFYPGVMFAMLTLPLLDRWAGGRFDRRRVFWPAIGLFWGAQLVPWIVPGDAAVTGEGRLFSVTMLDAFVECRSFVIARTEGAAWKDLSQGSRELGVRIGCDPLVLWNRTRPPCAAGDKLHVAFFAKRRGEAEYAKIIDEENFCVKATDFEWLGRNSWIQNTGNERTRLPVLRFADVQGESLEIRLRQDGRVHAVQPGTQALVWTAAVGDVVGSSTCSGHDEGLRVVSRSLDVFGKTWQSSVVALRKKDGQQLWRSSILSSSDLSLDCGVNDLFAFDALGLLVKVDPRNGEILWARHFQKPVKALQREGDWLRVTEGDEAQSRVRIDDGTDPRPEEGP